MCISLALFALVMWCVVDAGKRLLARVASVVVGGMLRLACVVDDEVVCCSSVE